MKLQGRLPSTVFSSVFFFYYCSQTLMVAFWLLCFFFLSPEKNNFCEQRHNEQHHTSTTTTKLTFMHPQKSPCSFLYQNHIFSALKKQKQKKKTQQQKIFFLIFRSSFFKTPVINKGCSESGRQTEGHILSGFNWNMFTLHAEVSFCSHQRPPLSLPDSLLGFFSSFTPSLLAFN